MALQQENTKKIDLLRLITRREGGIRDVRLNKIPSVGVERHRLHVFRGVAAHVRLDRPLNRFRTHSFEGNYASCGVLALAEFFHVGYKNEIIRVVTVTRFSCYG